MSNISFIFKFIMDSIKKDDILKNIYIKKYLQKYLKSI